MTRTFSPERLRMAGHEGVEINVWDYGGSGRPLFLCHCTGACGRVWDPVAAQLTSDFHIYAWDSRGHGDSGKPRERAAYRWSLAGHDLLAVADALGLPTPMEAVGHSGGGAHVAYAEMHRSGRLGKVLLIDAIIGPESVFSGENPLAAKARRRRAIFASREEARSRFASKPPMNTWQPEVLDAYLSHGLADLEDGRVALKCPSEIEAWLYELGGACDLFERLNELTFPVRLVTGEGSEVAPLVATQSKRLPRSEVHVVPGAGHFVPQEKPLEVAELIREWFRP